MKQIMDHEIEIVRDIQALHSDMQTLVYENYNKFISATDTIRKVSPSIYVNLLSHFCSLVYFTFSLPCYYAQVMERTLMDGGKQLSVTPSAQINAGSIKHLWSCYGSSETPDCNPRAKIRDFLTQGCDPNLRDRGLRLGHELQK